MFGLFLPPITAVGAIRLARPGSWWARRWYGAERRERAVRRTRAFDARWSPLIRRWDNLVGGAPTRTDPRGSAGI